MQVKIERLGINGEGVGSIEGKTLFVDGALPNEVVEVEIIQEKRTYSKGKLVKIITPSDERVEPICPLFGECGGCQVMHLKYEGQLKHKQQRVIDAFERIGKLQVEVEPCIASDRPLHYRNKILLPANREGKLGLYRKGSHDIVAVEKCYIHSELGEEVFSKIEPLKEVKAVLIRTAIQTEEVLVVFVTGGKPSDKLKEVARDLPVKGVVHNLNNGQGNRVLGRKFETLCGADSIEDLICDLRFKVSPESFFQVNPAQAEKMYKKALELAQVSADDVVLDAYCGVGTLALVFAPHVKEVIGVECIEQAIVNAKANAKLNGIENVKFVAAHAESYIAKVKKCDVAIVNPPRKGCDSAFLDALMKLAPKKIIYISCDPATLARDLKIIEGYQIRRAIPFDMFPQTAHVETLVVLDKI